MFGIGKSAEQRQREKERKKRGNRKYGQAVYKHSRQGIVSSWCGAAAFLILGGCFLDAYLSRGEAAGIIGGVMIISFIFVIWGIRAAVRGFREKERNYITCKIGLGLNAFVLIVFLAIFIGGLS